MIEKARYIKHLNWILKRAWIKGNERLKKGGGYVDKKKCTGKLNKMKTVKTFTISAATKYSNTATKTSKLSCKRKKKEIRLGGGKIEKP